MPFSLLEHLVGVCGPVQAQTTYFSSAIDRTSLMALLMAIGKVIILLNAIQVCKMVVTTKYMEINYVFIFIIMCYYSINHL